MGRLVAVPLAINHPMRSVLQVPQLLPHGLELDCHLLLTLLKVRRHDCRHAHRPGIANPLLAG